MQNSTYCVTLLSENAAPGPSPDAWRVIRQRVRRGRGKAGVRPRLFHDRGRRAETRCAQGGTLPRPGPIPSPDNWTGYRPAPRRRGPATLQGSGPGQDRAQVQRAGHAARSRTGPPAFSLVPFAPSVRPPLPPGRRARVRCSSPPAGAPGPLGGGPGCSALFSRARLAPLGCGHGAGRRCRALRLRPCSSVAGPLRLVAVLRGSRRGVFLNSSAEGAGLRPRCAGPPRARPPT